MRGEEGRETEVREEEKEGKRRGRERDGGERRREGGEEERNERREMHSELPQFCYCFLHLLLPSEESKYIPRLPFPVDR